MIEEADRVISMLFAETFDDFHRLLTYDFVTRPCPKGHRPEDGVFCGIDCYLIKEDTPGDEERKSEDV